MTPAGINRRIALATISAALLTATAGPASAQADKPLRLGFSMARTGMLANATPSQMNTYELWRDQVNALGGMDVGGTRRKVEFVVYDDQSKPEQAVRIYEKLITDDKVDLLLAPWGTPFHISIAPVLEKFKFPDGRQHRCLGRAAPGQARLHLVPDLGHSGSHRRRTDRDAEEPGRQVGRGACQRPAVHQGDQELPRAGTEEGRHRDQDVDRVSTGHQGHDWRC